MKKFLLENKITLLLIFIILILSVSLLATCFGMENYENVEVLKENKLIQVKLNGKTFKIDLIEQRPPKNK